MQWPEYIDAVIVVFARTSLHIANGQKQGKLTHPTRKRERERRQFEIEIICVELGDSNGYSNKSAYTINTSMHPASPRVEGRTFFDIFIYFCFRRLCVIMPARTHRATSSFVDAPLATIISVQTHKVRSNRVREWPQGITTIFAAAAESVTNTEHRIEGGSGTAWHVQSVQNSNVHFFRSFFSSVIQFDSLYDVCREALCGLNGASSHCAHILRIKLSTTYSNSLLFSARVWLPSFAANVRCSFAVRTI